MVEPACASLPAATELLAHFSSLLAAKNHQQPLLLLARSKREKMHNDIYNICIVKGLTLSTRSGPCTRKRKTLRTFLISSPYQSSPLSGPCTRKRKPLRDLAYIYGLKILSITPTSLPALIVSYACLHLRLLLLTVLYMN